MRLTWSKRREPGRYFRPEYYVLKMDGREVIRLERVGKQVGTGWFWYTCNHTRDGLEYANTCRAPKPTLDEAKAEAVAWVKAQLATRVAAGGQP